MDAQDFQHAALLAGIGGLLVGLLVGQIGTWFK